MKYQLKSLSTKNLLADILVIANQGNSELNLLAKELDQISGGKLAQSIQSSPQLKQHDTFNLLPPVPYLPNTSILFIHVGKKTTLRSYLTLLKKALAATKPFNPKKLAISASDIIFTDAEATDQIKQTLTVLHQLYYTFDAFKSEAKPSLQQAQLIHSNITVGIKKAFQQAIALNKGMTLTQDLANTPGNICTPQYLAKQAKALAKRFSQFTTQILEETEMKKLGMGALLAVSQGSKQPAKLIIMKYQGAEKSAKPHVFVGKGVTFDTGGVSMKSPTAMVGMKYDMCGGATVFGVMQTAATLKLKQNIIGVVAAVENMPDGNSYKPEDIVTTLSGQTVEVLNTDAEGRLALCDALTYIERFKPKAVIDLATLTGAMVISLGTVASGVFTNHQPLADKLIKASEKSLDRAWQMPLFDEYQQQLDSPFADMANIGGSSAGSITAACFLSRFTKKYHWAHMDIAGTAANWSDKRWATGRPLPLLMEYLLA